MRNLATIDTVLSIDPIPNADNIEVATVRGWQVVVRKGEFKVGDEIVYFEIDSALPLDNPAFAFLADRGTKQMDKPRHVLKTIKLRKQVSQGLIMPLSIVPDDYDDLTTALDVVLYDPVAYGKPIPANVVGKFPDFLPKTDAERVQNVKWLDLNGCYATEKIDGMSTTIFHDGLLHICTRDWEINPVSYQLLVADDQNIVPDEGWAIQAEFAGPGIQQNRLGLTTKRLFIFNVFCEGELVPRSMWPQRYIDSAVPVMDLAAPQTVADAVAQADGIMSVAAPGRLAEGIVWHSLSAAHPCIKAISNKYLLKES